MKNIASLAFSLLFSFSLSLQGQPVSSSSPDTHVFGEVRAFHSGDHATLTWTLSQQRDWAFFAIERFQPGSASPEWLGGLALHAPVSPGLPFSYSDELGTSSASPSYRIKAVTRSEEVFYSEIVQALPVPARLIVVSGSQSGQFSISAEGQPLLSLRVYNANGQEELFTRLGGQPETFFEGSRLPSGKHIIVVETPVGPVAAAIYKP